MEPLRNVFGEIDYPTTDGEPMGETDLHRQMMVDLIESLQFYYQSDSQTYVSGNILLYYEEGNPLAHLSPDVMVTRGLAKHPRETYKLWVEGKAPDLVVEVTSRSTRLELCSDLVYGREKKVACPTGIESNQKPGRTRYEN